jgi:hypothetical protein
LISIPGEAIAVALNLKDIGRHIGGSRSTVKNRVLATGCRQLVRQRWAMNPFPPINRTRMDLLLR